MITNDLGPG